MNIKFITYSSGEPYDTYAKNLLDQNRQMKKEN